MKHWVVISLLLTFLSLQTPFHEVFKLPVLVAHYMEHKEQDEEMSLYSFLKIHYADDVIDADYDRDMQLPFKHCCTPIFIVLTVVTNKVQFELNNPLPESKEILTGYKNQFISSTFHHNIWQPPKAV